MQCLCARTLHISTRPLYEISVEAVDRTSLGKISVRDLLGPNRSVQAPYKRSIGKICSRDRCASSLQELSWQDPSNADEEPSDVLHLSHKTTFQTSACHTKRRFRSPNVPDVPRLSHEVDIYISKNEHGTLVKWHLLKRTPSRLKSVRACAVGTRTRMNSWTRIYGKMLRSRTTPNPGSQLCASMCSRNEQWTFTKEKSRITPTLTTPGLYHYVDHFLGKI